MDRTLEFFELCNIKKPTNIEAPATLFISAANDVNSKINNMSENITKTSNTLWKENSDIILSEIQMRKDEIEILSDIVNEDINIKDKLQLSLQEHRQTIISTLWDKLQSLTGIVRSQQLDKLNSTYDVNTFFVPKNTPQQPVEDFSDHIPSNNDNDKGLRLIQVLQSTTSNEIEQIQSRLQELSLLMTNFSNKVIEQSEQISSIHLLAEQSTEYIIDAQSQLKKALDRGNSTQFYQVMFYIWAALFLLAFDAIKR